MPCPLTIAVKQQAVLQVGKDKPNANIIIVLTFFNQS